jgi:hypothetical protein
MSAISEQAARDPLLAEEIARLTPEQQQWLEQDLALRQRADLLAHELKLDESDVYHQLKQLRRSPTERLRRGLNLGRRRPQSTK